MNTERALSGSPSLTVKQVAALEQVAPKTIRRLLQDGELPGYKVGRDWRVTVESFVAWRRGAAT
jgi:excisionase family DNA binding protein